MERDARYEKENLTAADVCRMIDSYLGNGAVRTNNGIPEGRLIQIEQALRFCIDSCKGFNRLTRDLNQKMMNIELLLEDHANQLAVIMRNSQSQSNSSGMLEISKHLHDFSNRIKQLENSQKEVPQSFSVYDGMQLARRMDKIEILIKSLTELTSESVPTQFHQGQALRRAEPYASPRVKNATGNLPTSPDRTPEEAHPRKQQSHSGSLLLGDYSALSEREFKTKYACSEMNFCNFSALRAGSSPVPEFKAESGNFHMITANGTEWLLPKVSFLMNIGNMMVLEYVFNIHSQLRNVSLQAGNVTRPAVLRKKDGSLWICSAKGSISI